MQISYTLSQWSVKALRLHDRHLDTAHTRHTVAKHVLTEDYAIHAATTINFQIHELEKVAADNHSVYELIQELKNVRDELMHIQECYTITKK